ncbi:MAG: hypothetical protein NTW21_10805 [Verrucomicrobia bacterium]|nr:hypothetical protein [Verrucomicrobiota bacterium]
MDAPSPQYLLSRAGLLIALLVAVLVGMRLVRKFQRQAAITAELGSLTSDSAFFQQFYAEDARKSLVRAIGLLAEANSLGVAPNVAIDRGLGLKPRFFASDAKLEEPPVREKIIRTCLRGNYENFIKLGYRADFHTLDAMKRGELPPIPSGPNSGHRPELAHLISPALAPGLEKLVANLEIRPPQPPGHQATPFQVATAKQLARELADARLIEEAVCDRILEGLSTAPP